MSDLRKLLDIINENSDDGEPQIGDYVEIEMGDTLLETYIEDITEDGVVIKVDETAVKLMIDAKKQLNEAKQGLWANIHAKRERIKHGSGERMRKPGSKGAPSAQDFKDSQKTSKNEDVAEGLNQNLVYISKNKVREFEEWMESEGLETEVPKKDVGKFIVYDYSGQDVTTKSYADDWNEKEEGTMDEAKYQGREVPLGKPMAGDVKKSKVYVKKPNGKVVKVNFGDKNMRIKKSNPKRKKSFRARHHCENPGPRWKARYWSCRAW